MPMPMVGMSPSGPLASPIVTKPTFSLISLPLERGVERDGAAGEVHAADEVDGLGGAVLAVHPGVFPLDGEGTLVADAVEGADDRLELDVAVAGRHEVPAAAAVAEVEVGGEDAVAAVDEDLGVLDVAVVDAVGELVDELGRIDELPDQVGRVEVEAELLAAADGLDRPGGGVEVVGDLGRVHLEREAHTVLAELVEDRVPAVGELLEAGVDHGRLLWREREPEVPDRRAGEAGHDVDAEVPGGAGRGHA